MKIKERKKKTHKKVIKERVGFSDIVIVALIGAIGTIIAGYFGYLGKQQQITVPIDATKTAEFANSNQSFSGLNIKEAQGTLELFFSDAEFEKCLYAWSNNDNYKDLWVLRSYDTKKESLPITRTFVLLSTKEVVIRKIKIKLVDYDRAPPLSSFFLTNFNCSGRGGWEVQNLVLNPVTLFPDVDTYSTTSVPSSEDFDLLSLPYQMGNNESISFQIFVKMAETGVYTVQVEIEATDFHGVDYIVKTNKLFFKTLYLKEEEFNDLQWRKR